MISCNECDFFYRARSLCDHPSVEAMAVRASTFTGGYTPSWCPINNPAGNPIPDIRGLIEEKKTNTRDKNKILKSDHIKAFNSIFGDKGGFTEAWAGWIECARFLGAIDE